MAFEISKEHCCMLLFVCCFLLFLIWLDCPSKSAQTVRSFMGTTPPQLLGQEGFDPNEQKLTNKQKQDFEDLTQDAQKSVEKGVAVGGEGDEVMDLGEDDEVVNLGEDDEVANLGEDDEVANLGEEGEGEGEGGGEGGGEVDQQVRPSLLDVNQEQNQIMGYTDDLLYASATAPYGVVVPISLQQDYSRLKSIGKLMPQHLQSLEAYNTASTITDSQFPQFDPTAKGGLLASQMGGDSSQESQMMGEADGQRVEPELPTEELDVGSPPGTPPGSPGPSAGGSVEIHMVYADWCGHSQNAKGPYQELMKETQGAALKTKSGKPLSFLMTEEADEGMGMFKDAIQGFPTFMTVVKGPDGNVTTMEELPVDNRDGETIKKAAMALSV